MICMCMSTANDMCVIMNVNGNTTVLTKQELKAKMMNKQLEVTNLQLTSNGRLIKKEAVYWPLAVKVLIENYRLAYIAIGACDIKDVAVNGNTVCVKMCNINKSVNDSLETFIEINNNFEMNIYTIWKRCNKFIKKVYRCKNVKATEKNILKYGLTWRMGNKYDFSYMDCQRGLGVEVIREG